MSHVYETHKNCTDYGCPICDGGLQHCTVCGGAESSLTSECCGHRLTEKEEADVMTGRRDFKGGLWREAMK